MARTRSSIDASLVRRGPPAAPRQISVKKCLSLWRKKGELWNPIFSFFGSFSDALLLSDDENDLEVDIKTTMLPHYGQCYGTMPPDAEASCKDILDRMSTSRHNRVFGPQDLPGVNVVLPFDMVSRELSKIKANFNAFTDQNASRGWALRPHHHHDRRRRRG